MSYITVCTPTYNRGNLLYRPYQSLCNQTFKDFIWLIIDDGSTDDTKQIVEDFIGEGKLNIKYIYKKNGGRASALNESYKHIDTKYVINLDSDDAYLPDALMHVHDAWESIPESDRERFWCVTGHSIDSSTGKQIGKNWPEGINNLCGEKQHKVILKYKGGEKSCCRRIDVLKKYPFPVLPGTNFVPEDLVWEDINRTYDQFCVNDIFRIYYTDSCDSLSKGKGIELNKKIGYYYLSLFYLNKCYYQFFYNKWAKLAPLNVARLAIILGKKYSDTMKDISNGFKRLLVSLSWPIMMAFVKVYYK